ncbi:LysM peptidoglycan-binding domain-containing protein [Psychrobacillus sp.]|uniref:LysM peptidoglycan-binding domain-containing protein n=1 Tax=Psychrobacillus sp. TaxID=1871623 RepID=UPI0028BD65D5|nr:LysM peptidoglycan-binding domain-containing protein [Psychrobacillus sp.]
MHIHIVTKGDTLWKIARSYNVSFEELKKLNAHLANPEYIVPGMKIFIPETKKMESINHPFSEHRPVNKKSEMREEINIQQHPGTHPSFQPVQPIQPSHLKQQMRPVPSTPSVHPKQQMHPVQPSHPTHPKEQMRPIQPSHPIPPKQQVRPVPIPVPIIPIQPQPKPVPDLDMTQSPGGWRLIESTSIHINIHNDNREVEFTTPVVPSTPVVPVIPPPKPTPPVQQVPPPVVEEATPIFPQMFPCDPCQQMQPCDPCQQMQPFPFMHHQMHPHMFQPMLPSMHPQMHPHMQQQMQGHGGMPCAHVCFVPVYPCPPFQPF